MAGTGYGRHAARSVHAGQRGITVAAAAVRMNRSVITAQAMSVIPRRCPVHASIVRHGMAAGMTTARFARSPFSAGTRPGPVSARPMSGGIGYMRNRKCGIARTTRLSSPLLNQYACMSVGYGGN